MLLADTSPAQGAKDPVAKETASCALWEAGPLLEAGLVGEEEEGGAGTATAEDSTPWASLPGSQWEGATWRVVAGAGAGAQTPAAAHVPGSRPSSWASEQVGPGLGTMWGTPASTEVLPDTQARPSQMTTPAEPPRLRPRCRGGHAGRSLGDNLFVKKEPEGGSVQF